MRDSGARVNCSERAAGRTGKTAGRPAARAELGSTRTVQFAGDDGLDVRRRQDNHLRGVRIRRQTRFRTFAEPCFQSCRHFRQLVPGDRIASDDRRGCDGGGPESEARVWLAAGPPIRGTAARSVGLDPSRAARFGCPAGSAITCGGGWMLRSNGVSSGSTSAAFL